LPPQVAGLVFYLAQDEAAAITGANVRWQQHIHCVLRPPKMAARFAALDCYARDCGVGFGLFCHLFCRW
jgi:hypothetical protein